MSAGRRLARFSLPWTRDSARFGHRLAHRALLIDGRDFYRAFYAAALGARKSIVLLGWQFDSDVQLLRGDDLPSGTAPEDVQLLAFLDRLCRERPALEARPPEGRHHRWPDRLRDRRRLRAEPSVFVRTIHGVALELFDPPRCERERAAVVTPVAVTALLAIPPQRVDVLCGVVGSPSQAARNCYVCSGGTTGARGGIRRSRSNMHLGKVSLSLGLIALAAACGMNDDGRSGSTSSRVQGDPLGNNGTVKIQEVGSPDEIPDNDPHVGCAFNIEFRGFDEGDLKGTWELTAHPPSGTGAVVANGEVGIGEDSAGGAGDLDAVVTVDLRSYDLSALERHPQQGYHLKLEVHAEGSIGADTKYKVFWVDACTPEVDAGAPPVDAGGSSTSSSGGSSGKTW